MSTIVDVTQETFATAVLERSHTVPVVIDFWAAWCGPCRQLSPLLEKYAAMHSGDVEVVKIDVDSNQELAGQFRVQGIPAVKAVKAGKLVAEFTGLQPEPVIAQFFDSLAPSKADRLVAEAAAQSGDEQVALLEQALDVDAGHVGAILALAPLRAAQEDNDGALALLARVPHDPQAQKLTAELELAKVDHDDRALAGLRDRATRGDGGAMVAYGRALAAAGRHQEAADQLLLAVQRPDSRESGREALVALFTTLGNDHPLVTQMRPKLARALF